MIDINDADFSVNNMLKENNILFNVVLLGETIKGGWDCDQWRVTLSHNSKSETFDYFTGLAHRVPRVDNCNRTIYRLPYKIAHSIKKRKEKTGEERVIYGDNWSIAPTSASFLYSLILDAEAADQSFSNWCSNYGYDEDSMSAFNTYQECEKIAKKLKNIFSYSQIEQLRELLEDY